jgi:transglutaminase-like putative cysteine protease
MRIAGCQRLARLRLARSSVWFGIFLATAANAQTYRQKVSAEYVFAPDRSFTYTVHSETTPLAQSVLQGVSQTRYSVNGNQTFEVVEAYTRKSDGQQIAVNPSEIVSQDGVVGPLLSFADIKIRQVPFKNVAVGDTVVATVRYTERHHYLGDGFSASFAITPSGADVTSEMTVRRPATMPFIQDAQQFNYEETPDGDRVVHHWSGHFQIPQSTEQNVADLVSRLPRISFSTFASYEDIGKAFSAGAGELLNVTPAIASLADDITRGRTGRREQAEAIFDWVTGNIRYLALVIGVGRVVPNPPETVIANRYGDCKDVATLMSALLAAKGIASEFALINTNPVYQLDATPLVGSFNHVIVYLPELDLYADPTAAVSFVGRLPRADRGKPVLRVSKDQVTRAQTPIGTADDNVARVSSRLQIGADEVVQGETTVEGSGEFAQVLRRFVVQSEGKSAQVALDALGKQLNIIGEYGLEMPPATSRAEPYGIKTKWTSDKPLELVAKGMKVPAGLTPITTNVSYLFGQLTRNRVNSAVCQPGRVVQEVSIQLPEGIMLKNLPKPIHAGTADFEFTREWSRHEQTIVERSELRSTVAGGACSPATITAVANAVEEIRGGVNPTLRFERSNGKKD